MRSWEGAVLKIARALLAVWILTQPQTAAAQAAHLLGPAIPQPIVDSQAQDDNSYLIGPNNLLHIKILNEGGMQQAFRVDDMGYITHPLAGRIKLAGKTVAEAEESLVSVLSGDYIINPYVTIFVLEHSRFSVLGEVRKPGNYEITGRLSVVEAVSIAGGFTPVANERKVKILRRTEEGEKTLIVNVRDIMDGRIAQDVYVEAGDVIDVQKSFF